jgi:hypothetical protein
MRVEYHVHIDRVNWYQAPARATAYQGRCHLRSWVNDLGLCCPYVPWSIPTDRLPLLGLDPFKAMLHCMLKLYNLMSATQPSRTPVRFQSHPMDT